MNHLKRKLGKLTNEQLKHVCNKMGVKHGKSKKFTINILLKPFVKKYKAIENSTTNTSRSRNRSRNRQTDTVSNNYWRNISINPDSDGRQHYTQEEIKRLEDMYSTGPDSEG
jgi:hypothetical protein